MYNFSYKLFCHARLNILGRYKCNCTGSWTGKNCTEPITTTIKTSSNPLVTEGPSPTKGAVIGAAFAGTVCAVGMAVGVGVFVKWKLQRY